jgi:hypothetical protein
MLSPIERADRKADKVAVLPEYIAQTTENQHHERADRHISKNVLINVL